MPTIDVLHNLRCADGRTIREHNLEIAHAIPVGTLVEISPWDDDSSIRYGGVRLFVAYHSRDCDGSPLYSLGVGESSDDRVSWRLLLHGFCDDNLRVITKE